jgi:hypothetical protein
MVAVTVRADGVRIEGMLEEAHHQHARVVAEGFGGAVAVVDVEVDDGDPLQAVHVERMAGGDGDIVEQAKAHRLGWPRVVARAGGLRRRRCRVAGDDRVGGGHRGAGGAQGRLPAVRIKQRVAVDWVVGIAGTAGRWHVVAHLAMASWHGCAAMASTSASGASRWSMQLSIRLAISWSSIACRLAG